MLSLRLSIYCLILSVAILGRIVWQFSDFPICQDPVPSIELDRISDSPPIEKEVKNDSV
jgi:hypothetical protein